VQILVSDFSQGQISHRFATRVDTAFRTKGAQEIEGFVVAPDGGLRRKPGTLFVRSSAGIVPNTEGLFAEHGTPSFQVLLRRENSTGVPHIAWVQDSPRELRIQNLQDGTVDNMADPALEAGEPMHTSGQFAATEDDQDQHALVWTPTTSWNVDLQNWGISRQTERHIATVFQNRLIAFNRDTGYLWMSAPLDLFNFQQGVAQQITVDVAADAGGSIDGTYFTLSSPLQTYYVWLAVRQRVTVVCSGNTVTESEDDPQPRGELDGKYFVVSTPAGSFYVWYTTGASGTDPKAADTSIRVTLPDDHDADATLVANYTQDAIALHPEFDAEASGDTVTIIPETAGSAAPAADAPAELATGFSISTQSLAGPGGDPAVTDRPLKVNLDRDAPAETVATAVEDVLAEHFAFHVERTGTQLTITNDLEGAAQQPVDGQTGFTISVVETGRNDSGHIAVQPDFYARERVNWIVARQSVYAGTDSGEYEILSSLPYYSNQAGGVIINKIGRMGGSHATYFGPGLVVSKDYRLVFLQFQGQDRYAASTLTEYIDNGEIIQHEAIDYGPHQYLFMVDIHRDLYCMTQSRSTQVIGWAKMDTDVGWIATHGQDLYIAKERAGSYWIEVLGMDGLAHPGDRTHREHLAYQRRRISGDAGGFLTVTATGVTGDPLPASTTMEVYRLEAGVNVHLGSRETTSAGELTGTLSELQSFSGYSAEPVFLWAYVQGTERSARVKTLPLFLPTQTGATIGQPHIIHTVIVQVFDTEAFRIRVNDGGWETWQSPTPHSGPVTIRINSQPSDEIHVELESVAEKPLNVRSITAEVQVGEL